jgi:hypothetical protein
MLDWRLASYQLINGSSFWSAHQLLIGVQITERHFLLGYLPLLAGPKITTVLIDHFCQFSPYSLQFFLLLQVSIPVGESSQRFCAAAGKNVEISNNQLTATR